MWRPRLMVVDDDEDVANLISYVATGLGFRTKIVSGVGAFIACSEFEPDVIVLDIFMPEIDGFEVLRYLGETNKDTSVVIVSGKDGIFRDMAAQMCEQQGIHMVANIAKPFTITHLRAVLSQAKKYHQVHAKWSPVWVRKFIASA